MASTHATSTDNYKDVKKDCNSTRRVTILFRFLMLALLFLTKQTAQGAANLI